MLRWIGRRKSSNVFLCQGQQLYLGRVRGLPKNWQTRLKYLPNNGKFWKSTWQKIFTQFSEISPNSVTLAL